MTALPPKTSFTDVTVTKGSFKVALDNQHDYLTGLLGSDGVPATARTALGIAVQAALSPAVRGSPIINGYVTASVGGSPSQLTIALKTNAGADPSASDPVYVVVPKNSASSAAPNFVAITTPTTLILPSGASLGHQAGILQHLFIYGVYDDGSPGGFELAVSTLPPDYPGTFNDVRKINTTAVGSGSNSASGIYSVTARSNVSWVALAMGKSTQTVAGSWDTALSQLDPAPFRIPSNKFRAYQSAGTTLTNNTIVKISHDTIVFDPDNVYSTANKRFQPNVAGYYDVKHLVGYSGGTATQLIIYIYKNGTFHSQLDASEVAFSSAQELEISALIPMNGTSDYLEGMFFQQSGANPSSINGNGGDNYFTGGRAP